MIETAASAPESARTPQTQPRRKPGTGLRERSKQERQEKITLAARRLFAERGYDAATLREIAAEACLGLGTLFNYISDKRDLIYMIFNHEFETLTTKALLAPQPWQSFTAKILSMTELHYQLLSQEPTLSRILLSEILLQTPGMHLERWRANRWRLIHGFELLVAAAQTTGEIGSKEEPEAIARLIFFTFSSAIRWWLASPDPDWRLGQQEFSRILEMQMRGIHQNA